MGSAKETIDWRTCECPAQQYDVLLIQTAQPGNGQVVGWDWMSEPNRSWICRHVKCIPILLSDRGRAEFILLAQDNEHSHSLYASPFSVLGFFHRTCPGCNGCIPLEMIFLSLFAWYAVIGGPGASWPGNTRRHGTSRSIMYGRWFPFFLNLRNSTFSYETPHTKVNPTARFCPFQVFSCCL